MICNLGDPVSLRHPVALFGECPMSHETAPQTLKRPLYTLKKTPIHTQKTPIHTPKTPIHTQKTPIDPYIHSKDPYTHSKGPTRTHKEPFGMCIIETQKTVTYQSMSRYCVWHTRVALVARFICAETIFVRRPRLCGDVVGYVRDSKELSTYSCTHTTPSATQNTVTYPNSPRQESSHKRALHTLERWLNTPKVALKKITLKALTKSLRLYWVWKVKPQNTVTYLSSPRQAVHF